MHFKRDAKRYDAYLLKTMKKSLLITIDFYPTVGGISNYWHALSSHLPSDKWIVLAPKLPKDIEEMKAPYRIYRRKFFSAFMKPKWLPLFFHIIDIIKKEKIEKIVVAQLLPIGTAVWLISKLFKIQYLVSVHGMDISLPLRSRRKKMICRHILMGADHIIANSKYTGGLLKNYVPSLVFQSIYPCPTITSSLIQSDSTAPESLPENKKILLTVGRLVKRKGHEDVICALKDVLKVVPNLCYVIVGDGGYKQELFDLVEEEGLTDAVLFVGEVSDSEVAKWYRASTVCIMTSKELRGDVEGFGIVYLEANAFGKPVIASRSGGVEEAVMHGVTGIVVEPENIEQIKEELITLFTNSKLAADLGQRGNERVNKEFQWSVQAKKLESLLG